jgi:hypothetical protein
MRVEQFGGNRCAGVYSEFFICEFLLPDMRGSLLFFGIRNIAVLKKTDEFAGVVALASV